MSLLLFAVFLFVQTSAQPPTAGKPPGNNGSKADNSENQSQQTKRVPDPATVRDQPSGPSTEKKTRNNITQSEQAQIVADERPGKDGWDIASICATLALVFVGIITFGAILYQAIKTREATDAINAQTEAVQSGVKIQRTAMQQWVDIGNWKGAWEFKKDHPKLNITFDLMNPTGLPLTMTVISVTPSETVNTNKDIPLNPRESYTHHFSLQLTKHHSSQSDDGSIWLDFLVFVVYKDAFKDQQLKGFGKSCLFNLEMRKIVFEHYRRELPVIFGKEEDDDERE